MQSEERVVPIDLLQRAVEAEAQRIGSSLGGPDPGLRDAVAAETRREAWVAALAANEPGVLGHRVHGAGLRVAARALRRHGVPEGEPAGEPTPIPDGLTAEALRGALSEVIPGRRSVAGLYLRGYTADEMAGLYALDGDAMESRLDQALEDVRSTLHRRAERMNRESWSRALEARPIAATRGMLREGSEPAASRLGCTSPEDLASAVRGTHFRGGREGALDHAATCDPCARELRLLLSLRTPAVEDDLNGVTVTELRRAARRRRDLRPFLELAPGPARPRRRIWPWIVWVAAAVGLLILLL